MFGFMMVNWVVKIIFLLKKSVVLKVLFMFYCLGDVI